MDFFASQDAARKKTGLLIGYFVLALVLIIIAIYFVALGAFGFLQAKEGQPPPTLLRLDILAIASAATLLVVGLGTLYKTGQLKAGGAVVAESLGGRRIKPSSRDPDERLVLNVVEEMAIASGTPVPPVYLLDAEPGINAFAAGFTPDDAVIGVTRGCIELLSRDQLQGVIAHEFSHILNGDMRLNIRFIGVLHGLLLLSLIGYYMFRIAGSNSSRRSSNDKSKGGGAAPIILLGLGLYLIGYVGVFFGRLIKSAISRQREYLADSAAVQFTRNPEGISGALKSIGGLSSGAQIKNPRAEEASHLFFGRALRPAFFNLMSTHPPLDERIRRIDPHFNGSYPAVVRQHRTLAAASHKRVSQQREHTRSDITPPSGLIDTAPTKSVARQQQTLRLDPKTAVAQVGTPTPQHLVLARHIVASLPAELRDAVLDPVGATATLCALLLTDSDDVRQSQFRQLRSQMSLGVLEEVQRLAPLLRDLPQRSRLPLLELALPALRTISQSQYAKLCEMVEQLVMTDQQVELFEYVLQRTIQHHLATQFQTRPRRQVKFSALRPLLPAVRDLFSHIAHAGHRDEGKARAAFASAIKAIGGAISASLKLQARDQTTFHQLDAALDQLAAASPQIKKRVLTACAECIQHDGKVEVAEGELLRVISDALDCPMPPLLLEMETELY